MSKCKKLKDLIQSKVLSFLMECHDGLSAKIVEEAGFKGGWISGLCLSAAAGVRDRNELSFKEVADLCYYICSRTSIPMLLDMDTGYGDFNTASIAVKLIEKSGVAGVCIEDKKFPKHNSFHQNTSDDLEDPQTFAGKIKAIKDSTEDPDFVVVARLEEFISGAGLDEALKRARIYSKAGADAILVHSKIRTFDEIESFMNVWNKESEVPVIIVPTKYYQTPTTQFRRSGISTVIWANHNLRSCISAMQTTSRQIFSQESLCSVEDRIATVPEVFRLQDDESYHIKEREYLPAYGGSAVILSGGSCCTGLKVPRCFTPVGLSQEQTVYSLLMTSLKKEGVHEFVTVIGQGQFDTDLLAPTHNYIYNSDWSETSEVDSLGLAFSNYDYELFCQLPLFIVYGDLVLKDHVFRKMSRVDENSDLVVAVDPLYDPENYNEFVFGDKDYDPCTNPGDTFNVQSFSLSAESDQKLSGSLVGVVKVCTSKGYCTLREAISNRQKNRKERLIDTLSEVVKTCKISGVYVPHYDWVDVNHAEDILRAQEVKLNES